MDVNLIFEELRPLGEANHVPDDQLTGRGNAGRAGDNEERGWNRIQIERDRRGASVPRAVRRFL